ncbi:MAG: BlaI/MecI/CopY family transcriptional regulator [Lachnospiraceae bacterium]|nr:BlaI/MecI/CopY family transcriptional regulator [Lachnospiraceae bacterium]
MRRLPESELELMMIIWDANHPVTRMEIEDRLEADRKLGATTILSFLARLEEKGFLSVKKEGKLNIYTPIIQKQEYLKRESGSILKRLYRNSITDFVSALADGGNLSSKDIDELQEFLNEQKKEVDK